MPTHRLTRSQTDGTIAGVCAGLADYLHVDVVLIRAAWVVLSIVPGAIVAKSGRAATVRTLLGDLTIPSLGAGASHVALALRPEHLRFSAGEGAVPLGGALVKDVVFQGSFKRVTAVSKIDPQVQLIAKAPAGTPVAPDDTVDLFRRPEDFILLER